MQQLDNAEQSTLVNSSVSGETYCSCVINRVCVQPVRISRRVHMTDSSPAGEGGEASGCPGYRRTEPEDAADQAAQCEVGSGFTLADETRRQSNGCTDRSRRPCDGMQGRRKHAASQFTPGTSDTVRSSPEQFSDVCQIGFQRPYRCHERSLRLHDIRHNRPIKEGPARHVWPLTFRNGPFRTRSERRGARNGTARSRPAV
jgi:hypothetical protein